ncbi:2Fe-2S iron-sulfur cluster-binding protein [Pusillimonas sp.]|uniref:2Fe-2S iron-sulfur cluster-binding protein n=1 Tax=Pusillimonas sp. TaxID=3040095 RepID=UPI0029B86AEE|nr:2Fe-2S iron-sulfur cluster-binding protein [Pusillimonas sp.]MDX3894642.1 2Fe-2S iron-sulfur cluster-binding protein [Pusillimonas sp.]
MIQVIYIQPDGSQDTLSVEEGTTLMQAAVSHGIVGIIGECGGSAMCATCHVFVEPGHLNRLPPMNAVEDGMLDSVAEQRCPNSRLSCQLVASSELDGLIVHIPTTQV